MKTYCIRSSHDLQPQASSLLKLAGLVNSSRTHKWTRLSVEVHQNPNVSN
ncbi:hypothetical protein [Chamaesiphon sp. OTE_20_metabat_361]|nr:hypothetical protein [Chamaesiphon sp. OTE_20_metabat_361]